MFVVNNGPSGDAWGTALIDPVLVAHESRLVLFARAKSSAVGTLYFTVLDPSAASAGDDLNAWNGWYRYSFPEVASASLPENAEDAAALPPAELRLAGMDLLTVPPVGEAVASADASFRVVSDGAFLVVYRQAAAGTLLMNRLGLLSRSEDVGGATEERFSLESAWEVRFRRSGLRDVPLDQTDGEAYLDPTGEPFYEPAIEFPRINGSASGAYDVAQVPTADPEVAILYAAVATTTGVQLHQVRRTSESLTDYTETPVVYPLLTPTLRGSGTALTPIAGLSPALSFYAEQETASTSQGNEAELQRAGHLMVTIPVTGGGLSAALAVYDFSIGADGNISVLPTSAQSLPLVDGTLSGGVFTPDTASPAFPTPANMPSTIQIVDGLLVSSMVLGQIQPHGSPSICMGDDGLVHVYFGGPLPTAPFDRWSSLDPNLPQAMVAQFDARANRLVLSIPWLMTEVEEQQNGAVEFFALQSGAIMTGTTLAVSSSTSGTDLCEVSITYPSVSTLPAELWKAVPRELGDFMDVLNGNASADSADPAVLSGDKPFYDPVGALPIARLPLTMPAGVANGPAPAVTLVSTRSALGLQSITVAANGANQDFTLVFTNPEQAAVTLHWTTVPPAPASFGDVFSGSAAPRTYAYPPDPSGTPLFALRTDAVGVPAPVILYSLGTNANAPSLTISVADSSTAPGKLDAQFVSGGAPVQIKGLPPKVEDFVAGLKADAGFQSLALGVNGETAGGDVVITPTPVGRLALAATAALFDVLVPAIDLTNAFVTPASYNAFTQGHSFQPASTLPADRMAGFLATSLRPSAGAAAYVQNATAAVVSISRSLHPTATADPLVSGVWLRARVQQQCSFSGTDSATVPVLANSAVIPASLNLRPQWDWTLEAWVCPTAGRHSRVVSFLDNVTQVAAGAPTLSYAVALESQKVIQGAFYNKQIGTPDSSYFQTLTSTKASFMPAGAFTWECWIKPNAQAAPLPASGVTPIGGVIQLGQGTNNPFLILGLTADRFITLATVDQNSNSHTYKSNDAVPNVDASGLPTWSHISLIGRQDPKTNLWTLQLLLDAGPTGTFTGVELQVQSAAVLVIGGNTPDNTALFGSMAQIRYWSIARSAADIRRTWLTSLSGFEPGLLGNWPLTKIESGGPTQQQFVRNTAAITNTDWDADFYLYTQPLGPEDDSFFLSTVATVAGLAPVQADTMLANDRWNHLALVYQAGGALAMNSEKQYQKGVYDWMNCGPAESLGPASQFAVDAYVRIAAGTLGQLGTIVARWSNDNDPDSQCFRYWIDDTGEMNLSVAIVVDDIGTITIKTATSSGAALADSKTHHVAVAFSWVRGTGSSADATWTITFYKDGATVGTKSETITGIASIDIRNSQGDLTVGAEFSPIADAAPMAAEDFYYLRGTLGKLQFWTTAAPVEALFPEKYPRIPLAGQPKGLGASWNFREQAGRLAADLIGGNDGKLSNSSMWTALADTSKLSFIANGAAVGAVGPAAAALTPVTQSQFTLGAPVGGGSIPGFSGDIAQVALYDEARSLEMIQDQMFVPRYGNESGLIACWNFSDGGADITGGQNDIQPSVPATRLSTSAAPLSNEGPYVRNAYGGVITDHAQSAPGRIAVGSYADAQNIGTARQRGVLKRQYVVDPTQTFTRAIQIGELDLTYLGQVQTDPTLIGYIEGAPPVPSENLTRPYYLDPGNPNYMIYMDTATVSLVQQTGEQFAFSSSSAHTTQIDIGAAFGLFGVKNFLNLNTGAGPFSLITPSLDLRGNAQAIAKGSFEIGSSEGESAQASWGGTQRDTMGVNGDWEPYQSDQTNYLNPQVGRRFLVDNSGYALVESLTADLYALTFGPTKASVGTIILPNPAIPPDRNIIVFPMNGTYTKNGTLDGKVGLVNDPAYPDADSRRGSYFKPVEAYALAASIDRQRQRSKSIADQFDPARQALASNTSLDAVKKAQSQDFSETPGDPVAVATPVQGLVNRYVWTSNGGFHAEEQSTAAASVRSYSGNVATGGGGGFHADGEFFLKFGFAWSFDVMATHRVNIQVSKESTTEQALSMEIKVAGDAYLRTFNPDLPGEYGGKGVYNAGQAPGKVSSYRFMTIYLPPSSANSSNFARIVDPAWYRLSNDPDARALRQLKTTSGTWRVLHRVTYVQRIPPPIASRPVFTPSISIVAPVNIEGNTDLIRLIDAQIPAAVKERTRLIVGNAVAVALNPSPTSPGVYPASKLEALVPWWLAFLNRARPGANTPPLDPAAATLLVALVSRTTAYMFDGYASGVFDAIL